jgi:hypothetical protein
VSAAKKAMRGVIEDGAERVLAATKGVQNAD